MKKINESNNINPIEPFLPDVFINQYDEEVFVKEGRGITNSEILLLTKEYISPRNFLNEEKSIMLQKIWRDCLRVNDIFKPLKECKLRYTLDLTGGAVRDFVLNNHNEIKDLDFMLKIEPLAFKDLDLIMQFFSKDELYKVGITDRQNIYLEKDDLDKKLIELCLNRNSADSQIEKNNNRSHKIYKSYVDRYQYSEEFEGVKKDRLSSVVKIEDPESNFPIDLLVTDFPKNRFIEEFDFDLCKVSFSLVNPFYDKKFPQNYSHLISRFVGNAGFWADFKNKKLTLNIDDLVNYEIDRSIENHLPRLKAKFPEYELNIVGSQPAQLEYLDKVLFRKSLREDLPKKESKIKKNKI